MSVVMSFVGLTVNKFDSRNLKIFKNIQTILSKWFLIKYHT